MYLPHDDAEHTPLKPTVAPNSTEDGPAGPLELEGPELVPPSDPVGRSRPLAWIYFRSDGRTPGLCLPKPKGRGSYVPTMSTLDFAGIFSSRPTAQ